VSDATARAEISLDRVADALTVAWQPVDVVRVNETMLRMARLEGTFPWHHHDEDELFLCWRGVFSVEMDGRPPVHLEPGELCLVERGRRHRTVAVAGPAYCLLIERPETKQYGEGGTS